MTTTYDPFHPKYFDEDDLRERADPGLRPVPRLPAVLQVLHVVPHAVRRSIDRHDDQDAAGSPTAEQDQVVDECFELQALLRQLPVHPRPARVGRSTSPG